MRLKIFLTSLIVAGLLTGAVFSSTSKAPANEVLAITTSDSTAATVAPIADVASIVGDSVFEPDLTTRLDALIANYPELDIAVSLIDLDTGAQFNAGLSGARFKAASTTKVLTAAAYLYEVQQGNAILDQTIDGVPAWQLLEQSIEVSDNAAWDSLRNYLGDKQQTFANQLGLDSYEGGDLNIVSAADLSRMLVKLYEGNILADSYTTILFEFMAQANATDLIAGALPDDAVVLHKYGELWGNLHDIALVKYQGHRFALAILTNDPAGVMVDRSSRAKVIQQLTTAILQSLKSASFNVSG